MVLVRIFIGAAVILGVSACAGKPGEPSKDAGVLSPMEEVDAGLPPDTTTHSPAFQELSDLFKTLGYEGVGLEYESSETLSLLKSVFSDPRSHRRQIRLVYTGLNLAYDPRHQSLTVGGTTNKDAIVGFIQKKIPAKP